MYFLNEGRKQTVDREKSIQLEQKDLQFKYN